MKKGITVAMLVVIVSVIGILTTATIKSISNSYTNAKLSVWITEVELVQDLMNENKNNVSDMLLDEVIWDLSKLDDEARTEQIKGETIADDKVVLKEINLSALGVDNALYGIQPSKLDVYAYSEKTGKVYYLKGIKVGTKRYYTLTSDLKNRFGDNLTTSNLSLITFEQSEVNNTENAVKVTVKVPKAFINVTVTTSNAEILVSAPEVKEDKIVYIVNTNEIKANYDITVTYIDNGAEKTVMHKVDEVLLPLGSLIKTAEDYGKTVNYVSDNGVTGWKIFYHTDDYVYLIASERLVYNKMPTILSITPKATIETNEIMLLDGSTRKVQDIYWTEENAPSHAATIQNSALWMANWEDYDENINGRCASYFLDETYWRAFKNTTASYASYVKGAIGTPTAEMFVESWNAKRAATNDTTKYDKKLGLVENETVGYYVNDITTIDTANVNTTYQTISTEDNLYIWSTVDSSSTWLASPAGSSTNYILYVYSGGYIYSNIYSYTTFGVRPVVCLKSNIPAKVGTTTDFSIN